MYKATENEIDAYLDCMRKRDGNSGQSHRRKHMTGNLEDRQRQRLPDHSQAQRLDIRKSKALAEEHTECRHKAKLDESEGYRVLERVHDLLRDVVGSC